MQNPRRGHSTVARFDTTPPGFTINKMLRFVVTVAPFVPACLKIDFPDFAHGHGMDGGGGLAGGFVGLFLALQFARVLFVCLKTVFARSRAASRASSMLQGANVPDGAADSLPVQLCLEHECFKALGVFALAGVARTRKPGALVSRINACSFPRWAGQALDCPGGQFLGFAQVRCVCLFRSCHRVPLSHVATM